MPVLLVLHFIPGLQSSLSFPVLPVLPVLSVFPVLHILPLLPVLQALPVLQILPVFPVLPVLSNLPVLPVLPPRDSQRGAFLSRGVLRGAAKDQDQAWTRDLDRSAYNVTTVTNVMTVNTVTTVMNKA